VISRRLRTWVALGAFLCSLALPVLEVHPIGEADDAACQVVPANVALRIGATPRTASTPEHCIFCHLQRALGGAFASDIAAVPSPSATLLLLTVLEARRLDPTSLAPFSRGPPSLFSL
jgi:hypothetical protein